MAIKSAPYYWIVCDGDGCDARHPPLGDDIGAWSDQQDALFYAEESDWECSDDGDFCPDCVVKRNAEAERSDDDA